MDNTTAQAIRYLAEGSVICFPTETIYALAADASNDAAVEAIYQLKGRKKDNPLSLMVPTSDMACRYAVMSPQALRLSDAFWPGPLTLILPLRHDAPGIAPTVTHGLSTIGIRIPDHPIAQEILKGFGKPIVATSVNPSGLPPARTVLEVRHYYPKGLYIVEEAGSSATQASTIIDMTGMTPRIVRQGGLAEDVLRAVWEG